MGDLTYTWQVTENNGGGLTLYVWEDDKMIYAHAGYEYVPANLREDLANLQNGGDPIGDGWEGNDLTNEEIVRAVRNNAEEYAEDPQERGFVSFSRVAAEDKIFDADGDIIPLVHDEYYDDHETTRIICDQDGPIDCESMGAAGRSVFCQEVQNG